MISRHGVNEVKSTPAARVLRRKYRSSGRLMAYTWKREAPDGPVGRVFLEQASMISPLMALLFCRDLAVQSDQTLVLNGWLRLRMSVPEDVPRVLADRAATIFMELRKTIDRFIGLGWLELGKLAVPKLENTVMSPGSSEQAVSSRKLGSELRKVMVASIVKMLDADAAHWHEYRLSRQEEIAEERERLKEEVEAADALLKDEKLSLEADEDEDGREQDIAKADVELDDTNMIAKIRRYSL